MLTLGYTSVPALLKYLRHAEALGLDLEAARNAAGVTLEDLADNGRRIPSEAHERLLQHLMQVSGDPLFGLHSARYVQPGSWSVLGYITMNCANLGEAMSRIAPYEKLVGDMGVSSIEALADHVRLIWTCRHEKPLIRRHMVENVLASWLLYARWIADMDRSPQAVWFEHAQPADTSLAEYEAVFGCSVLFEQPCSALLVPLAYLAVPLRQADVCQIPPRGRHIGSAGTYDRGSL
mgnify:FL=1